MNSAFDTDYPGTNLQSSTSPLISRLERPVQITSDIWLVDLLSQVPASPYTYVQFSYTLSGTEINQVGSTYPTVPISEAGLFLSDESASLNPYDGTAQQPVAYVTFTPYPKLNGSSLEFEWVLRV